MLRWILRLILMLLAGRFLVRASGGRGSSGPKDFDPIRDRDREKPRDETPLSPYEIEDADFEELPRQSG